MRVNWLIFCVLIFWSGLATCRDYSLDEKIDLLYEAIPGKTSSGFKKELNLFIKQIKAFDNHKPAKRIKKIFDAVQSKYLRSYYLYAFFPDIANGGQFNCVTGTALFAILFDELGIPYHVVEVPQHVYMVAYPESEKIAVESTDRRDGIYNWTEQTKQEAIGFLVSIEKVTIEEVKLKGIDAIIAEFFYSNAELNFEQLVGLHFMNRAIYLSDKKDYAGAINAIDRSRELYESPQLDMIEGGILIYRIDEMEANDIAIVGYMTRYYLLVQKNPEQSRILKNFEYVMSEALITRRDVAFVDSAEAIVKENLPNPEAQNKFLSIIEETRAIWHYNRGKMKESMKCAARSYELNPENKNVEDILAATITAYLHNSYDISYEDLPYYLDSCRTKYPFLKDAPRFVNFEAEIYTWMVSDYFEDNLEQEGLIYLKRMQEIFEHPEIDLEELSEDLAEAYAQVATYYFRHGKYEEALKWIDLALEYDPESGLHISRKKNIVSRM